MIRYIVITTVCLFMCACTREARDQAAADAYEGVDAMERVAEDPKVSEIGHGVKTNILATRGFTSPSELPRPQMTYSQIVSNPPMYQRQAEANMRSAQGVGMYTLLGVAGAGLLAFAMKSLGIGGPILQWATSLMQNKKQKEEAFASASEASLARLAIREIEDLPPEHANPIKKAISHEVDPDQEKAIRRILREEALKRRIKPTSGESLLHSSPNEGS